MKRSVRNAAVCLAGFAVLLLLESAWVGIGPRWSETAREWAGTDTARHTIQLAAGGFVWLWISWSLLRGRRWARLVAIAWAVLMSAAGTLVFLVIALMYVFVSDASTPSPMVLRHPVEMVGGIVSILLLIGCALNLNKSDAREYFTRQRVVETPVSPVSPNGA